MKDISKVIIGNQITALEPGLFKDMPALEEVDFTRVPGLQIPRECFSGCTVLKKCECPTGSLACEDLTFFKCASIDNIKLADTAVSVGISALYGCARLSAVTNTNKLTAISDYAFQGCASLPQLNMPKVTSIGDSAFRDCIQLSSIDRFNGTDNLTLAAPFETVGEYAFANTNIKKASLTLRASADRTWWGEYCFASCVMLEEVEFLSSYYLGSHMFDGCKSLSSIKFVSANPRISYVGKYVFKDCSALTSVTFSNQQFSFLEGFFEGCTSLKEVKFDDYESESGSFCYVQKYAFNRCDQLTSIEFPVSLNSLTKIEDAALSNCPSLTCVHFHGINKDDIGTSDDINARIEETGFFRLNHDCEIVTDSGDIVQYVYRPGKVKPYTPAYEYAADKTTRAGFKTPYALCNSYPTMKAAHMKNRNPWYYNIREVVQQAAADGIPVLCFYSYETCTPCQAFKTNIYEAPEFQDWVKKQKFLICRIEADKPKAYDKELSYCEDELTTNALNYQRSGGSKPTNFNAFGDTDVSTPFFKGWFMDSGSTNKNLTPPVMVFYYKDHNGNMRAYHAYSLHPLDLYINATHIGIAGIIQMIKSLCLYHFDDNNLVAAKYVVDAGKAFNKKDYALDNPYAIPGKPNAISIDEWDGLTDRTPAAVMAHMADILSRVSTESHKYPSYIGGCLFDQIDWINWSFDVAALQEEPEVDKQNDILDKVFVFIGSKSYKLKLDKDKCTPSAIDTPCGFSILYEYTFIEAEYQESE